VVCISVHGYDMLASVGLDLNKVCKGSCTGEDQHVKGCVPWPARCAAVVKIDNRPSSGSVLFLEGFFLVGQSCLPCC